MRRNWFVGLLVWLAVLCLSPAAAAAKDYHAPRFDVTVVVEPGGALLVTERIQFAFGDDAFTTVSRGIPLRRLDGLDIVAVSMDGVAFTRGSDPGQFSSSRKDGERRVVWHFASTRNATRTFEFTYRVRGATRVEETTDLLRWRALPSERRYAITCAAVSMRWPTDARLLAAPTVDGEPLTTGPGGGVTRERCGDGTDAPWIVEARFEPRSVAAVPPAWQARAVRTRQYLPLWLGLGGMILLVIGGAFTVHAWSRRPQVEPTGEIPVSAPPDATPASLGCILARRASIGWDALMATVFGLAERGVLEVNEAPGSFLKKRDFTLALAPGAHRLRPSEQALVDQLFTREQGAAGPVSFSKLGSLMQRPRSWKAFKQAVTHELRQHGWLDEDREHARGRAFAAALVTVGLGVVVLIGSVAVMARAGDAVLALGFATILGGIVGVIAAATMSPLTDEGARQGRRWDAYGRYLRGRSAEAAAASAAQFNASLPAAVAFGAAAAWAKALAKHGVTTGPAWVRALPDSTAPHHMGVTVAMLASSQSAGQHAGHGASGVGGGVAGGGSSGAH